jgi:hypothetical protein
MACFPLRRRFAARYFRHSFSIAALAICFMQLKTLAFSAPALQSSLEIVEECVLLSDYSGCGQTLLRSDGSRFAIEPFLDYPEDTWLQVSGTITGLACNNPCVPAIYVCLTLEDVRLCDQGWNFCFGDGMSGGCPCSNHGGAGRGCLNTTGQGARFRTGGFPEVGRFIDIYIDGAPAGAPCVLVMGTQRNPLPFHDGILCLGPPYERLLSLTAGIDGRVDVRAVLSLLSGAQVGDTKYYQLWYGDEFDSVCGQSSNFTNAVQLDWLWAPPQ